MSVRSATSFECPGCLRAFDPDHHELAPRLLACGHSLCSKDLHQRLLQGCVKCPVDDELTPVEGQDASDVPHNFALADLMRRLLGEATQQAKHMCKLCEKAEAAVFCHDCPERVAQEFCQSCADKEHSSAMGQRHNRVSFAERPMREQRCEEHKEKIKLYCLQCETAICRDCHECGEHQGHEVRNVVKTALESQQVIEEALADTESDVEQLQAKLKQDARDLKAIEQSATTATNFINSTIDALVVSLRQRQQDMLEQVQTERNARTLLLHTRRRNMAQALAQSLATREELQLTLSRDSVKMVQSLGTCNDRFQAAHIAALAWEATYKLITNSIFVDLDDAPLAKAVRGLGVMHPAKLPPAEVKSDDEKEARLSPSRDEMPNNRAPSRALSRADSRLDSRLEARLESRLELRPDSPPSRNMSRAGARSPPPERAPSRSDGLVVRSLLPERAPSRASGENTRNSPPARPGRSLEQLARGPARVDVVSDVLAKGLRKSNSSNHIKYKWGSAGMGPGLFQSPAYIAVTARGEVAVTDEDCGVVQLFTREGKYLRSFGNNHKDAGGRLKRPEGVAVTARGLFIVADSEADCLQLFDANGKYMRVFAKVPRPMGVVVDEDEQVVVCSASLHQVLVLDQEGKVAITIGKELAGTANGEFNAPCGVAVDSRGRIIVSDCGNNRVQVFDAKGQFLYKFGLEGSGKGMFALPFGVAVDPNDNIVVVDFNNHRVQLWSSDGHHMNSLGTQGAGAGEFKFPQGVATDADGRIFVCDSGNQRIQMV